MISAIDIAAATRRIDGLVIHTPVVESERLNQAVGASLLFKCENLQRTGAFKYRGATNAVQALTDEQAAAGVATHSSGNHGAALARAATQRGIPSHIVVPKDSVPAKVDAIRAYGGDVVFCEPNQKARESGLNQVVREKGANIVHPYDDARVVSGQGTAAMELLRAHPDIDILLAPIGGGGLISGTALAAQDHAKSIQVIGAEPAGADDTWQSLRAGKIITTVVPDTIADGLRARVGEVTFPIIRDAVAHVLTVDDREIVEAMQTLWARLRVIVEPSSATTLAAITKYPEHFDGQRVGVILTGGNVALEDLPWRK